MKISFNSPEYLQSLSIRRAVFVEEQKVPEGLEVDEFESQCMYFLLIHEKVPAATGRLRIKNSLIKFERIATLQKYRGLGLGKDLVNEMMNYAKTNHPELTPYMHSQLDAVSFYERLGWSVMGEVFHEAGIPHLAMEIKPT
jgi:cysteine-S-conjugate beta-lyase